MRVLPRTPKDAPITWLEGRLDAWTASAAQLGLSSEQLATMNDLVETARADYRDALRQRQLAKDATRRQDASIAAMRRQATALIATIKAFADATDDQNVYNLARFDPPATPTPSADPVPPTNVRLALRPQGVIDVSWRGTLAQGTTYEVQRQLVSPSGQASPWTTIGAVPARTLSDAGVPAGTALVGYRLRAIRAAGGAGKAGHAPRRSAFTATHALSLGVPSAGDAIAPSQMGARQA